MDLKGMVKSLLAEFYAVTNGRRPERLVFYRDGVSEGQFKEVYFTGGGEGSWGGGGVPSWRGQRGAVREVHFTGGGEGGWPPMGWVAGSRRVSSCS